MPECHCTSFKCQGASVDIRTFRSHKREDQTRFAREAREASRRALAVQDEEISTYISTLTLSDKVSNSANERGGRLWSRAPPDPADLNAIEENFPTLSPTPPPAPASHRPLPHRSEIDRLLRILSDIERSVVVLESDVAAALIALRRSPQATLSPFPLKYLVVNCDTLQDDLSRVKNKASSVVELRRSISERLEGIHNSLAEANNCWTTAQRQDTSKADNETGMHHNTDHHFQPLLESVDPILQLTFFMIVTCHVILSVPRRGCNFMLSMIKYIVQLSLMRINPTLSQRDTKLMSDFPGDSRSPIDQFHLDGRSTVYAICPNPDCHCAYKPVFKDDSPIPEYPMYCTHRKYRGGSKCKERLLRPRQVNHTEIQVPIRPFVYFDFKDWVAGLLSRPGFEDHMDAAWDATAKNRLPTDDMHDIFDGSVLRDFKGPDGKHFRLGGDEGRYVFSLCVDFFNPLGNKQAGKKKSIGLISLICLNLPPDIRYKPENMFLAGIIPGPKEPPLNALNHYLTPLVDDFLDFWKDGVWFSRTRKFSGGRLVRCALIALVCDILGARKAAGFASCTHNHFCAICHCTRAQHGYGNTDYSSWKRRTNDECRTSANRFKDAEDEKEKQSVLDETGLRWSELLRLPYFEPARYVVVDAMHNLFLGLIKEHFGGILGIYLEKEAAEIVLDINFSNAWKTFTQKEQKSVDRIRRFLESPLDDEVASSDGYFKKLMRCHHRALEFAGNELGCAPRPRGKQKQCAKADWAKAIISWRTSQVEHRLPNAETSTRHAHVLTHAEMEKVRLDITKIVTPSWTTSIPANLGTAAHGKLKADQWRLLGATYFPISLILLWGNRIPGDPRSKRCFKILQVTVSLLSAIIIATSRVTSSSHADLYLEHMTAYLEGIRELFPDYKCHPNHHMAMHLHEYLRQYGPVHAWWTFPFERIIGMLQRIPNNGNFGEYEQTISRSFTTAANLRGLVRKSEYPEALKNCQSMFEKLVDPHVRSTLVTDILSSSPLGDQDDIDDDVTWSGQDNSPVPPDLFEAMLCTMTFPPKKQARFLSHLTIQGLTYTVSSKHSGNSQVLAKIGPDANISPSQIFHIFQVSVSDLVKTFIAVRCYRPSSVKRDPFARFPLLQTQMWSTSHGHLEIITPSDIHSHFARYDSKWEGKEVTIVSSLSRA